MYDTIGFYYQDYRIDPEITSQDFTNCDEINNGKNERVSFL